MELAIPIVALGGMYLVSNQNKKNDAGSIKSLKESFITSNNPNNRANNPNVLPNTNIPTTNYPIMLPDTGSNVNAYSLPNAVTDKFYNASVGKQVLKNPNQFGNSYNPNTNPIKNPGFTSPNTVYSLTGEPINQNKFQHNNMVPFFGAKIRGRVNSTSADNSISLIASYKGSLSAAI
jgi:hypothetical protein